VHPLDYQLTMRSPPLTKIPLHHPIRCLPHLPHHLPAPSITQYPLTNTLHNTLTQGMKPGMSTFFPDRSHPVTFGVHIMSVALNLATKVSNANTGIPLVLLALHGENQLLRAIDAPQPLLAVVLLLHAHAVTRVTRTRASTPARHLHNKVVDNAKNKKKVEAARSLDSADPVATTGMPMQKSEADSQFRFSLVHIQATFFDYFFFTRPWDFIPR
jgi:hypothetical protein